MKPLNNNDAYPAELWDNTDVPAWQAERVWAKIQDQQPVRPPAKRFSLLGGALVLLLSLGQGERYHSIGCFPINESVENITNSTPQAAGFEEVQRPAASEEELQTFIPVKAAQKMRGKHPAKVPSPVQLTPLIPPKDSIQTSSPPIARLSREATVLPQKTIPLLTESFAPLSTTNRPGTKLSMRLPELGDTDQPYIKRLWAQFKQFNSKGEVDWVELGIQPNGDGTFSIINTGKPTAEKPN